MIYLLINFIEYQWLLSYKYEFNDTEFINKKNIKFIIIIQIYMRIPYNSIILYVFNLI